MANRNDLSNLIELSEAQALAVNGGSGAELPEIERILGDCIQPTPKKLDFNIVILPPAPNPKFPTSRPTD